MQQSHNRQGQFILSTVILARRPCMRSGTPLWKEGLGQNLFTSGMPPNTRHRRSAELSSVQTRIRTAKSVKSSSEAASIFFIEQNRDKLEGPSAFAVVNRKLYVLSAFANRVNQIDLVGKY